jgi:hypothetical protein
VGRSQLAYASKPVAKGINKERKQRLQTIDITGPVAIGGGTLLTGPGVFAGIRAKLVGKPSSGTALGGHFIILIVRLASGGAKFVNLRAVPVGLEVTFVSCRTKTVTERDIRA